MHNTWKRWLTGLGAVAAGGLVLWLAVRAPTPPSPKPGQPFGATQVPGTQGMDEVDGSFWLSAGQLLCFKNGIGEKFEPQLNAYFVDTGTGVRTAFTEFNMKYYEDLPYGHYPMQVSPDGRWLLREEVGGPFVAMALDGSREVTRPRIVTGDNAPFAWTRDSRHWIDVRQSQTLVTVSRYAVDSPQVDTLPVFQNYFDVGQQLWMASADQAVVESLGWSMDLQKFSLLPSRPPTNLLVLFPPNVQIVQEDLSPAGDRMVFLCITNHPSPPLLVMLRRLFRRGAQMLPSFTHGLWGTQVGNAMGSAQPHPVGASVEMKLGDEISFLHWMPDGKRVTFWYHDALWTAPVN